MFEILHISTVHVRYDTRIFVKQASSCAELYGRVGLLVADNGKDEIKNNVSIISSKYFVKKARHILNPIILLFLILLLKKYRSRIYHFHDPELILVAAILGFLIGKNRVIIDVHESTHEALRNKTYIPLYLRSSIANIWNFLELFTVKYFIRNVVAATPYIACRYKDIASTVLVMNYPKINDVEYVKKSKDYDPRNICYIGNINSRRGLYEVLKIWEHIGNKGMFYVVGDFSDSEYERLCKGMNTKNVKYLGHQSREEIVAIVSKCSIGILPFLKGPNHDNAVPNKFFEYMAYGLQVISNELPLLRTIAEELSIPVIVDITKIEDSATAFSREFSDYPHLKGQSLSKIVWSKYNWNVERDKLLDLYVSLLERH